jgi:hypothetical protein
VRLRVTLTRAAWRARRPVGATDAAALVGSGGGLLGPEAAAGDVLRKLGMRLFAAGREPLLAPLDAVVGGVVTPAGLSVLFDTAGGLGETLFGAAGMLGWTLGLTDTDVGGRARALGGRGGVLVALGLELGGAGCGSESSVNGVASSSRSTVRVGDDEVRLGGVGALGALSAAPFRRLLKVATVWASASVRRSSPLSPANSTARCTQRKASCLSPFAPKIAAVSRDEATVSESDGSGSGMSRTGSIAVMAVSGGSRSNAVSRNGDKPPNVEDRETIFVQGSTSAIISGPPLRSERPVKPGGAPARSRVTTKMVRCLLGGPWVSTRWVEVSNEPDPDPAGARPARRLRIERALGTSCGWQRRRR